MVTPFVQMFANGAVVLRQVALRVVSGSESHRLAFGIRNEEFFHPIIVGHPDEIAGAPRSAPVRLLGHVVEILSFLLTCLGPKHQSEAHNRTVYPIPSWGNSSLSTVAVPGGMLCR